jgi:hypothetical protein
MAKRSRPVKPLNEPTAVTVRYDRHGVPVAVALPETVAVKTGARSRSAGMLNWEKVAQVEDIYEIDELWWRGEGQEIQRIYFDLRLDTSRKVTVYHDLISGRWHRQAG